MKYHRYNCKPDIKDATCINNFDRHTVNGHEYSPPKFGVKRFNLGCLFVEFL